METIVLIAEIAVTILGMIFVCFFTSGIEWGIPGSIFEKKSTPQERIAVRAAKEAEERGTVRGGRKQTI